MDNYHFDVTSQGDKQFQSTLSLALSMASGSKVTHYAIDPKFGLVFFWSEPKDLPKDKIAQPLPYPMDRVAVIDFAANWLKTADYGRQPDHDGDNGKGWRVYNEAWGHVMGSFYGVIAVAPVWAMYGK